MARHGSMMLVGSLVLAMVVTISAGKRTATTMANIGDQCFHGCWGRDVCSCSPASCACGGSSDCDWSCSELPPHAQVDPNTMKVTVLPPNTSSCSEYANSRYAVDTGRYCSATRERRSLVCKAGEIPRPDPYAPPGCSCQYCERVQIAPKNLDILCPFGCAKCAMSAAGLIVCEECNADRYMVNGSCKKKVSDMTCV